MGALRPVHIIVLLVVIVLLFGARRLPDLARSVGQSLKIFKDEVKDLAGDGTERAPTSPPSSAPQGAHDPTRQDPAPQAAQNPVPHAAQNAVPRPPQNHGTGANPPRG